MAFGVCTNGSFPPSTGQKWQSESTYLVLCAPRPPGVLVLSPNDDPGLAKGSRGVVKGCPQKLILPPAHAGHFQWKQPFRISPTGHDPPKAAKPAHLCSTAGVPSHHPSTRVPWGRRGCLRHKWLKRGSATEVHIPLCLTTSDGVATRNPLLNSKLKKTKRFVIFHPSRKGGSSYRMGGGGAG